MNPKIFLSFLLLFFSFSFSSPRSSADWKLIQSADTLDLYIKDQFAGTFVQSIIVSDSGKNILVERRTKVGSGDAAAPSMGLIERRSYDFDGKLAHAFQKLAGDEGASAWELTKDPENGWTLAVTAGGTERKRRVARVTENLDMTYALYKGIKNRSLTAGITLYDTMFDLTSGMDISMSAKCSGVPAATNGFSWNFITFTKELGREERWTLDTSGTTLYEEIFPFVARKKGNDRQRRSATRATSFSLIESLSIPAPRAARDNESIALRLDSGFAPDSSVFCFFRHQGAAWIVSNVARVCEKWSEGPPIVGDSFTKATTTMQSDDVSIRLLADSLAAGRRDRCDSIDAFTLHVFGRLEKRYSPTFSNAIETLKAGYGDCGEHAVLLGALLRAVHIPARVVYGLVYVKERKGYYYHAWVLAESHGVWVFADPAFGIFPAVRDRVPLVLDDTGADIVKIAKLIGRIRIEYVK